MNMALANESTDPHIQACNHIYGVFPSSSDLHMQSQFGFFDHLPFHEAEIDVIGEGSSSAGKENLSSSFKNFSTVYNHNSSPTSSPSSENSGGGYGFRGTEYLGNDVRPSLKIKLTYENCMHPNGSLLSFEKAKVPSPQNDFNSFGLLENFNPQQSDGNFFVSMNKKIVKEKQGGDLLAGWITCDATSDDVEEIAAEGLGNHKRPQKGESNTKSQKKQCTIATKKSKANLSPSKDPQSVAAKNRRERISERLKILQELVPNGSKVDLVTMLEKAISYVKFLQLQVKVLASDEFWPDQGGKAPELSQVKDAIDAILSSHQINKCSSSR